MRSGGNLFRHGSFPRELSALSVLLLLAVLPGCQGTGTGSPSSAPRQTITAQLTYAPNVPPAINRSSPAA